LKKEETMDFVVEFKVERARKDGQWQLDGTATAAVTVSGVGGFEGNLTQALFAYLDSSRAERGRYRVGRVVYIYNGLALVAE